MENVYKLYSSLPEMEQRKTWAEIDLSALRRNYRLLRDMATEELFSPRPAVNTIASSPFIAAVYAPMYFLI